MNLQTGLMLTAAALFSGIESPLGHVGTFGTTPPGVPNTADDFMGQVAQSYQAFESLEARRPEEDRTEVYRYLRAIQHGQQGGGEEWQPS